MQTPTGTNCQTSHEANGFRDERRWNVISIDSRRYTVCAHQLPTRGGGMTYCGALIDVTDLPQVTICCGQH